MIQMLAILMAASPLSAAEPTDVREWKSTAGTSIQAAALAIIEGSVKLKSSDGRDILVPLERLVEADRSFLLDHFQPAALAADAVPYPVGQASGPHDAGEGSTFFIYIPKSLKQGRKAPLLLFTGAGGGRQNSVNSHRNGAEINGWIVAASVQSKNGVATTINHAHAKRCVEHLIANLPVDPERVYFTGGSGGGAMAFNNSIQMPSAGAMPFIGYNKFGSPAKHAHYYVLGGAMDFNRYLSADAAAALGDRGYHRMYPGAHAGVPEWILDEAMTWLNGRFLADKKTSRATADELLDWETSVLEWIISFKDAEPHRAYYWCRFLQNDYRISAVNASRISAMATALAKDETNLKYADGLDAINAFSRKHYTGVATGSEFDHITPGIESAAAKLLQDYDGVPHVGEVIRQIGQKTRR